MTNRHNIFWLILLSATFYLYVQMIVQHGVFFDGLVYSTLANNLAKDVGTVFDPHISKFFFSHFHEHPTLGIYLESLFFKLLGPAYFVERLYSFTAFTLVVTLLYKFWFILYTKEEDRKFVWLPILLFLPLPLVFWSFTQNMLETTMTLFSLLSVYFIYKALLSKDFKLQALLIFLAALCIIASFFSKGPVGIFPLATITLAYVFLQEVTLKKMLTLNLLLLLFISLLVLVLVQNDALYSGTKTYLNQQVLASLEGHRNTVENRFVFFFEILKETTPLLIITVLTYLFAHKNVKQTEYTLRLALFFIAIGLSASVPIMVSTKQYGFYLVPSLPFFTLGICILSFEYIKYLVNKIKNPKYAILFFSLVFISSLIFTIDKTGQYSRDENRLKDLQHIATIIHPDTIIHTTPRMHDDASLNSYFMRNHSIELDTNNEYGYFLTYKDESISKNILKNYEKVDINLHLYLLYRAKIY